MVKCLANAFVMKRWNLIMAKLTFSKTACIFTNTSLRVKARFIHHVLLNYE